MRKEGRHMYRMDINCDMGEGYGIYHAGDDEALMSYISSANIACGFHASDPCIMNRVVQLAKNHQVAIGAHIGFPDPMGFGRRNMELSTNEIITYTIYQIGALQGFCSANKIELSHVKPHGALYNMAAVDSRVALAICEGMKQINSNLYLLAPAGSEMEKAAAITGLSFAAEVFADRAYEENGTLRSRSKEGAVIRDEEEILKRIQSIVTRQTVQSYGGKEISIQADSICVHGDGANAVTFLKKINEVFQKSQIERRSFTSYE
jgi:5-oxoprolinase (ATP-hydrolysing) subunit A